MIWLELRNENQKYEPGWNSTESVWAPFRKKDKGIWPFWNLLNNVNKGDPIIHLQTIKRGQKIYRVLNCWFGKLFNEQQTNN